MKKKIFSVLLILALVLCFAVPAIAAEGYEPSIGWWQPDEPPDSGTAEFSTTQAHGGDYSAYLEAYVAESPGDYHEVYVANPMGIDTLADLTDVSFWYFCPSSVSQNDVMPLIDVWLDTNNDYSRALPPTGDDEWLLGMLDDVTTFDEWVEVPFSVIEWVRATGGTVYGTGSAGLAAALTDLGDCPILAIGVETGGPGTYISSREFDQEFYIDDITINGITYGFEQVTVTTTVVEDIIQISINPTSFDFGSLRRGESSAVEPIVITSSSNMDIAVSASTESSFYNVSLEIGGTLIDSWDANILESAEPLDTTLQVVVPSDWPAGIETGTIIFWAEEYIIAP